MERPSEKALSSPASRKRAVTEQGRPLEEGNYITGGGGGGRTSTVHQPDLFSRWDPQEGLASGRLGKAAVRVTFHPHWATHCGFRKKLYWNIMVMKKPTKPSIVMATSPRVTISHSNGDFILSNCPARRKRAKGRVKWLKSINPSRRWKGTFRQGQRRREKSKTELIWEIRMVFCFSSTFKVHRNCFLQTDQRLGRNGGL